MDRIRRAHGPRGFGLVEVCVVLLVLGVLAAIAIPNYQTQRKAKVGRTAAEMRNIAEAFLSYKLATGFFPPDSFLFPPEMVDYLDPALWTDGTPIGGTYNWEGPNNFAYAGVSIYPPDAAPNEEYEMIDNILDDGNLATGRFKIGSNGRATFFIDESGAL